MYDRDGNFMSCKICTKAKKSNGMSKESQAKIFKTRRSFDMLVFKDTKWLTFVYMLFVPKSTGHMFIDLGITLLGLGLVVY